MTKATSRKTHLIVGVLTVSEGSFMIFMEGSRAAGGRMGMVLDQKLSAYFLIHRQEGERVGAAMGF